MCAGYSSAESEPEVACLLLWLCFPACLHPHTPVLLPISPSLLSLAIFAYTLVAYICQSGIPALGGVEWGFFVGYMIPCVMMILGTAIFVSGREKYVSYPPRGSVLSTSFMVIREALSKALNSRGGGGRTADTTVGSGSGLGSGSGSGSSSASGSLDSSGAGGSGSGTSPEYVLDRACVDHGGSFSRTQVQGVKLVARLTPFLLALVPFWGIYSQMSTAFQNQGCQMDLQLGATTVPISALNLFDSLAIVVFVPLFDQYLFPALKRRGYSVSILQRMGAGFLFSLMAMLLAAWVEVYRLDTAPAAGGYDDAAARDNITPCQSIDDYNPYQYQEWQAGVSGVSQPLYCSQTCDATFQSPSGLVLLNSTCISCEDIPQMSPISILWQVPQFAFVGMSEILASVASLEFFYTQAPLAMRSVTQALSLCTTAFGSFLVIPLVLLVNSNPNDPWLPANLNDGHLADYFVVLAALMAVNLVYFHHISKGYEYKSERELKALDEEDGRADGRAGADAETQPGQVERRLLGDSSSSSGNEVELTDPVRGNNEDDSSTSANPLLV